MKIVKKKRGYSTVVHDLVDYCNAQCIFCYNDWKKVRGHKVTEEIFEKYIRVLPLLHDYVGSYFLFSCSFEPTLHPDFLKLLSMIPEEYADKVFFTSNLVIGQDESFFRDVLLSNINYFNISIETFDKDKYKALVRTSNSAFYDNLEKLSRVCSSLGVNKKVRFITMLLNDNLDELESIFSKLAEMFSGFDWELRTAYPHQNISVDDAIMHIPTREMLNDAIKRVETLEERLRTSGKFGGRISYDLRHDLKTWLECSYPMAEEKRSNNTIFSSIDFFKIYLNPDGVAEFDGDDSRYNIMDMENVEEFFSDKLIELQKRLCKMFSWKRMRESEPLVNSRTKLTMYDERFLVARDNNDVETITIPLLNGEVIICDTQKLIDGSSFVYLDLEKMGVSPEIIDDSFCFTLSDLHEIYKHPVIWGAGIRGQRLAKTLRSLQIPFDMTDSNPHVVGNHVEGCTVKLWDELKDSADVVIVSAKNSYDEVCKIIDNSILKIYDMREFEYIEI